MPPNEGTEGALFSKDAKKQEAEKGAEKKEDRFVKTQTS